MEVDHNYSRKKVYLKTILTNNEKLWLIKKVFSISNEMVIFLSVYLYNFMYIII